MTSNEKLRKTKNTTKGKKVSMTNWWRSKMDMNKKPLKKNDTWDCIVCDNGLWICISCVNLKFRNHHWIKWFFIWPKFNATLCSKVIIIVAVWCVNCAYFVCSSALNHFTRLKISVSASSCTQCSVVVTLRSAMPGKNVNISWKSSGVLKDCKNVYF